MKTDNLLVFSLMTTVSEAMIMRTIRNECRTFMTHNQKRIGILEQFLWFLKVYKPALQQGTMEGIIGWLNGEPVAYGLIRSMENKQWISGGLLASVRGNGIGKKLFVYLTQRASQGNTEPVFLEVLQTNTRAQKIYKDLGYKQMYQREQIITMKKKEVKV